MTRIVSLLALLTLLAACSDQEMDRQASLRPGEGSDLWGTGTSVRPLPDGVVARGAAARRAAVAEPPPVTSALLDRGEIIYRGVCAPCHGLAGDGDGIVVQRGFSAPPSYHSARLRAAPGSHFVDVIGNGYGAMFSYGDRVQPADRWAVAAYVRALQLSRAAPAAAVPDVVEALP